MNKNIVYSLILWWPFETRKYNSFASKILSCGISLDSWSGVQCLSEINRYLNISITVVNVARYSDFQILYKQIVKSIGWGLGIYILMASQVILISRLCWDCFVVWCFLSQPITPSSSPLPTPFSGRASGSLAQAYKLIVNLWPLKFWSPDKRDPLKGARILGEWKI